MSDDRDGCANCARLEAENAALRREIERLRRRLLVIRRYCDRILQWTRRILSQPKGIKFSTWHVAEGADGVADVVERLTH